MDPLTAGILVVLGKYAIDKRAGLIEEVGPVAAEKAGDLFRTALNYLREKPNGQFVADEFEKDPGIYEKPVAKELQESLESDSELAAQLDKLLVEYEEAAKAFAGDSYQATADHGSAVAQGTGATATASRGVSVGGSVGGSIVTGDNDVVAGRDATVGISGSELAALFEPIQAAIDKAPQAQQAAAQQMAQELQEEAAKGNKANDGIMAGLIRGLVGLVPSAAAAVAGAFGSPILAGIAGPVTQAVLQKIQG